MSNEYFQSEEIQRIQGDIQEQFNELASQQDDAAAVAESAVLDATTTTLTRTRNSNIITLDIPATYLQATKITASATLNFDLTAVASQDLTITLTGAIAGEPVFLGTPNGSVTADTIFFAWISAANTATVRALRIAGTPDPASGTFTVTVFH